MALNVPPGAAAPRGPAVPDALSLATPVRMVMRGTPVPVGSNVQFAQILGPVILGQHFNAISLNVFLGGAASIQFQVEEAPTQNGPFVATADPNGNQTSGGQGTITANKDIDIISGEPYLRLRVTAVGAIAAAGPGVSIWATPFNMPGPVNIGLINQSITANQNLGQVGGNTVVTGGVNGSQGVGGLAAAGAATSGNPLAMGGQDNSGNAQFLQLDASKNLLVSLNTGLDWLDDAVLALPGSDYPAQVNTTISSASTTTTQTLVSGVLGGGSAAMEDVTMITVEVENTLGVTMSNAQIQFNDTVGSTAQNNLVSSTGVVSIPTGTVGQLVFLIPPGSFPLKNIQIVYTYPSTSTGSIKTQAVLSSFGHSYIGGASRTVAATPQTVSGATQIADNAGIDRALAVIPYGWDGTTTQNASPMANNADITVFASAARTTAQTGADTLNKSGAAIYVSLNVTVASGTGGLTIHIQGKDILATAYYDILVATAAVTATGQKVYAVGLGIAAAADGITQVKGAMLPRTWRVTVAVGDASSYTYSVAAMVVNG